MDARDRALRYLNARMCTAKQMEEYLRRKGHEDEEIRPLIEELKEYHYIDDLRYAVAFIQSGYEKKHGIRRIRSELMQKGISADVITSAEEQVEEVPDEVDAAMEVAERAIVSIDTDGLEWKEKEALKAKVARRLSSRGYSTETIYTVIGKLL